jgi:hypothetical protein
MRAGRPELRVAYGLRRAIAAAVAAQVHDDHAVPVGERRHDVGPRGAGYGEAVRKHKRVARPVFPVLQRRIAGCDRRHTTPRPDMRSAYD